VRQAVELLEEMDRQIIWMRHQDGLSHWEIAAVLEITENNAWSSTSVEDLAQSIFLFDNRNMESIMQDECQTSEFESFVQNYFQSRQSTGIRWCSNTPADTYRKNNSPPSRPGNLNVLVTNHSPSGCCWSLDNINRRSRAGRVLSKTATLFAVWFFTNSFNPTT
jgi:Sigma-70, region 4